MQPTIHARFSSSRRRRLDVLASACLALFWSWTPAAFAAVISLSPIADTTLSENYPSNNLGGLKFVNSGTTQNYTKNRGLLKFDIAGAIPPGARINAATLIVEVTWVPIGSPPFSDFGLHRVLMSWGEGNKVSRTNCTSCIGEGSPATTNEATWLYRFAFTTNTWTTPGGGATNDYVPTVSSSATIYGMGDSPYTFQSTPQTVADVQVWLDNPQINFGWMLICQSESTAFTARRFGSREDIAPRLEVEYIAPPQIDSVQRVGDQFNIFFTALPGQGYVLEFLDSFPSGIWQTLATLGAQEETTRVLVIDPISANRRFYRLGTQ